MHCLLSYILIYSLTYSFSILPLLPDEFQQQLKRLYTFIYGDEVASRYYRKKFMSEYKLNDRNIIITLPPTIDFNDRGARVDGITPIAANIVLTYSQNIDEKLYNSDITHKILSNVNMNAGIFSFAWSENDNLLVGCKQGVCIFRFTTAKQNNMIFIDDYADFINHPLRQQIDSIKAPVHGHLFATYTYNDGFIYIWDSTIGNVSPIRIINNYDIFDISWSLSAGLYIYVYGLNTLSVLETNSWTQSKLNLAYDQPINDDIILLWISGYSCIYTHPKTIEEISPTNIYAIYMNPNDPNSNVAFIQETQNLNILIHTLDLYSYEIDKMVANKAGNLLAICFKFEGKYRIHVFEIECSYKFRLIGHRGVVEVVENEFVVDIAFQESNSNVLNDSLIILCKDYQLQIRPIIANQNNN